MVATGELDELMALEPRDSRASHTSLTMLSETAVDKLEADYRAGNRSIYDLAIEYGVHRNTVSRHLKARGVVLGKKSLTKSEILRARALRAQGLSLNAVGREMGRDPKTVKAALG